jgi:hypothetical protein
MPLSISLLARANLHDARFEYFWLASEDCGLGLIVGDLQRGYSRLAIRYLKGHLASPSPQDLAALVDRVGLEILAAELDRDDNQYEHRFVLTLNGQVTVACQGLELRAAMADPEDYADARGPVQLLDAAPRSDL